RLAELEDGVGGSGGGRVDAARLAEAYEGASEGVELGAATPFEVARHRGGHAGRRGLEGEAGGAVGVAEVVPVGGGDGFDLAEEAHQELARLGQLANRADGRPTHRRGSGHRDE